MRDFRFSILSKASLVGFLMFRGFAQTNPVGSIQVKEPSQAPQNISTNIEPDQALGRLRAAPGFKVDLFAAEPMIAHPVSFAFDDRGRAFVVESHRRGSSVYDIRSHTNWLDADLSFRNVADRSNFFLKVLLPENKSLPAKIRRDLNGDGKFDFQDLSVESERIRLLEDRNGDGRADYATTYADGFKTIVSGTAGGVLPRGDNVWFTCIPDLWLLRDANNDSQADERKSLLHGFGVHIGLSGHGLHGLCFGPDGKIYFAIGDRGFNVAAKGRVSAYPDTGAVMRCLPDGSEFEVIATGLRNPQGLAFDQFGNLWTVDSNAESGDKASLLLVIEGADAGWHIGWQHLPQMGPWNEEKLGEIFPVSTAAYVLPPVAVIGQGSVSLAFYPGTGLPIRYDHHFFLSDPSGAVLSFALQPKGASYEVLDLHEFLGGLRPVHVDFGPGSGLYVADNVETSEDSSKGRIYQITDPASLKDSAVAETKRLLAEGMQKRSPRELVRLLEHRDRRVRQEAQFALADKGVAVTNQLYRVASKNPSQLARLHAIWALGQIGRTNSGTLSSVLTLVADPDPEVRAQATKVIGEGRCGEALEPLAKLLQDASPRVRLFAALGLGKLGRQEATDPILQMLRDNSDRDPYVRHAGVMALVWLNDMNALLAAAKDASSSVRMSVLLAMRRLARPEIAIFLYDANPALVVEAARAIYDLPVDSALSQLAVFAGQSSRLADFGASSGGTPDLRAAVLRRALSANFRLGKLENALALAEFAGRRELPEALRAEALELLAQWPKPLYRDPIVGLWRPILPRDSRSANLAARSELSKILRDAPDPVRIRAIRAAVALEINSVTSVLFELIANTKLTPALRLEALKGLGTLKDPHLAEGVAIAMADPSAALRAEASRWLPQLKPSDGISKIATALERGSLAEKQAALTTLASISSSTADQIIAAWLDLLNEGKVPNELQLDLLDVARQRSAKEVQTKIERYEASHSGKNPIAPYLETLYGGNPQAGQKIYFDRAELGCGRCHRIGANGGDLGPDLTKLGAQRSREKILESLLFPDKEITTGYETLSVTMKSGKKYLGRIKNETELELLLISPEDGFVVLGKSQILSRERAPSMMPADAAKVLSKRELRDLLEYLGNLK